MAGDVQVSAKELASWLGVSIARVGQLWKEEILKKETGGQYPLKKSVTAYIRYKSLKSGGNVGGDLVKEKLRFATAQADKIELENEKMKGGLVDRDEVVDLITRHAIVLRTRLLSFPVKLAPLVYNSRSRAEAKQILQNGVNEMLSMIKEDLLAEDES